MVIIPAIDILQKRCVRLYKGSYDEVTDYGDDPAAVAARYEEEGAVRIHIVDLDGARGDAAVNKTIIRNIRKRVTCVLELGGGIRSEADVEELLGLGIDRLVLGSILAKEPEKTSGWVRKYGPHFIAGIDALEGMIRIAGWRETAGIRDEDLAASLQSLGLVSVIYTNIAQDGTLKGPDIPNTLRIAEVSGLPVILSGGISSAADVANACRHEARGITGIIVGRALYEGKVILKELIADHQTGPGAAIW